MAAELVLAGRDVREARGGRVDGVLALVGRAVEDEVAGEELVVGDLVARGVIAGSAEFEEDAAQTGTGEEEVWCCCCCIGTCVGRCWEWEVGFEVGEDGVEKWFNFECESFVGPVAVELSEGRMCFGEVVGFGGAVPCRG